jgi:sarcosine oxidase
MRCCPVTSTPDEHFIIDPLPHAPQAVVVSPCSGHGFKFASIAGELAADLALDGSTRHHIGMFRIDRFDQPRGGQA